MSACDLSLNLSRPANKPKGEAIAAGVGISGFVSSSVALVSSNSLAKRKSTSPSQMVFTTEPRAELEQAQEPRFRQSRSRERAQTWCPHNAAESLPSAPTGRARTQSDASEGE